LFQRLFVISIISVNLTNLVFGVNVSKFNKVLLSIGIVCLIAACSNASKLVTQPMPMSGFLPDYKVLTPLATNDPDIRVWRYRISGVDPRKYTGVIIDPIYINQNATQAVSADVIAKTKDALNASILESVKELGVVEVVTKPGPKVVRLTVGITGAESSSDNLQPWDFTPVGATLTAASYAAGVNSKTAALLLESKLVDSQSKKLMAECLVTVQGDSFRTATESFDSFTAIAKKAVGVAFDSYNRINYVEWGIKK
jgi:hypothetical protein